MKATFRCAFDGLGCPEILIVEKTEDCPDGAIRYGACFEVVLWKNGVNVWRHYMDEAGHRCYWHKRLGLNLPVAEGAPHELQVEIIRNYIVTSLAAMRRMQHQTGQAAAHTKAPSGRELAAACG